MTPLLPPDPTLDGWYHLLHEGDEYLGKWVALHERWWVPCSPPQPLMSPKRAAGEGITLASRHPILTAAQLDALHALAGRLHGEKESAGRMCNRYVVGTVDWEREATRKAAYEDAANLLRAVLKGDAT